MIRKQNKRFAVFMKAESIQLYANKADTSSALAVMKDKRRGVVLMENSDAVRIGLCGTYKE